MRSELYPYLRQRPLRRPTFPTGTFPAEESRPQSTDSLPDLSDRLLQLVLQALLGLAVLERPEFPVGPVVLSLS